MTESEIFVSNPNDFFPRSDLYTALIGAQAEFGAVAKDADNPFFKSKYADLPAVKAAAQPVLTKHGLGVIQEPGYFKLGEKVYDTLATTVIHTSGQSCKSVMVLRPVKSDPQAQGSAITYAKRYAFMAVLGLVADDDDDGNAASGQTRKPAARRTAKPTPEDEDNAAVRNAIAAVKQAAKDAGATPKEATAYFSEQNNGASLINSTDLAALKAAYDHYRGIATAKSGLGATEVTE